jgi:hypothetical protein
MSQDSHELAVVTRDDIPRPDFVSDLRAERHWQDVGTQWATPSEIVIPDDNPAA